MIIQANWEVLINSWSDVTDPQLREFGELTALWHKSLQNGVIKELFSSSATYSHFRMQQFCYTQLTTFPSFHSTSGCLQFYPVYTRHWPGSDNMNYFCLCCKFLLICEPMPCFIHSFLNRCLWLLLNAKYSSLSAILLLNLSTKNRKRKWLEDRR